MSIIRVAVFRPTERVAFEEIENRLEPLQKLVGGYIESVPLSEDLVLICNEEGKLEGLTPNRYIVHPPQGNQGAPLTVSWTPFDAVCGTFFVCRTKGEEFASRPEDEIELVQWGPLQGWNAGR